MKKTIYLLLCITTIISVTKLHSQEFDPQLEYVYDATGNRTMRHVIDMSQQKSHQTNDSTNDLRNDTILASNAVADIAADLPQANDNSVIPEATATPVQYTENINGQTLTVYPNPTKGNLQVQISPFNAAQPGELTVYDLAGHLLIKKTCTNEMNLVDLSAYAAGSYIMKVKLGNRTSEWRIVKE